VPDDMGTRIAERIAALAQDQGRTIAVAESLTGGMVAQKLAAASGASEWFRGSLVAYSSEVKHDVLGVPDGPVVSADAARAMASGVRGLLGADVAVAVTGAGGPSPQDGQEPGTVYVAVDDSDQTVRRLGFSGEPPVICADAADAALRMLLEALSRRPR
jgi:nicotinamide-nucleotide amidase